MVVREKPKSTLKSAAPVLPWLLSMMIPYLSRSRRPRCAPDEAIGPEFAATLRKLGTLMAAMLEQYRVSDFIEC
jgi:hypothetical protein